MKRVPKDTYEMITLLKNNINKNVTVYDEHGNFIHRGMLTSHHVDSTDKKFSFYVTVSLYDELYYGPYKFEDADLMDWTWHFDSDEDLEMIESEPIDEKPSKPEDLEEISNNFNKPLTTVDCYDILKSITESNWREWK